jgi:acetyl esterase/lipase
MQGGPAFPEFSKAELAEARRVNRGLMYMPRFRAPSAMTRIMVQAMLRTSQRIVPQTVSGIAVFNRSVEWQGHLIRLRIIKPEGAARGVYLDYHGGGWTIGNAAMDDRINSRIAKECGLAVISIDYAMLPDVTFPEMIEECAAAADWVLEKALAEFGVEDLFIGGESAGAHLAVCSILRMRERRQDFARLKGAVLFYGPYDLGCTQSVRAASRHTLVLHGPAMASGIASLLPGSAEEERRDPAYSPLFADLQGLPPALFVCGDLDPLIDDSRLMAERWQAMSGNARLFVVPEAPHAFNRLFTRVAGHTNGFVRTWINALPAGSFVTAAAE